MPDKILEKASQLLRIGKAMEARKLIEEFLKDHRNDIHAWWLYAETWPDIEHRKKIWGYCLRFNPNSKEAVLALATLEEMPNFKENRPLRAQKAKPVSLFFKLFAFSAFLCIALTIGMTVNTLTSRPIDAAPYLHKSPVTHYLYVPENYTNDRDWPLFVGVHGGGGSGLDCWDLWQSYADAEGFILLCPSIPGDSGGFYQDIGESVVNLAIKDVRSNYRIQPKMFFAGFSAGAYFIQGYAYHFPQSVSGLAVLSTGYTIIGINVPAPIILVTGNIEPASSLQANQDFYDHMNERGYDIEYHILTGVGHWVSSKAKKLTIELFRKTVGR